MLKHVIPPEQRFVLRFLKTNRLNPYTIISMVYGPGNGWNLIKMVAWFAKRNTAGERESGNLVMPAIG